jgi:uncharacterized protein (DUF2147 family)
MRLTIIPVIAAALTGAAPALALSPQDIYGVWRNPDSGVLTQIYPCDGTICAKVVSAPDPAATDVKNPNPDLRGRLLVGIDTWRHAKETAPLQWSGSAYNPLDGATVYGTLHLTSDAVLVVASCNLEVMPCSERTWTKVSPEASRVFTTLVSHAEPAALAAPLAAKPKQAPAAERSLIPKPKLPYVYKAKNRKEPRIKNKPATPGDAKNDDLLSRVFTNW